MLRLFVLSVVLTVVLAVGVAAGDDIFRPVPRDHWSYDALRQLSSEGLLVEMPVTNTVGPGALEGGRPLTRYEFTVVVTMTTQHIIDDAATREVTSEQMATIKKLVKEFRSEIASIGVDVDALEKDFHFKVKLKKPSSQPPDSAELREMPPDHWAYEAMKTMYERGIFRGYPE